MNKENNGWISVKDELPETFTSFDLLNKSKVVLCYGKPNKQDHLQVFAAYLLGKDTGEFISADGRCYQVTHWQPIPQPPRF